MSTVQEKFQKSKPIIIRHAITIGFFLAVFVCLSIFEFSAMTLISMIGLVGTLAGVIYGHVSPKSDPNGTFVVKDQYIIELYTDLYDYANDFFQSLRKASLLVNPFYTLTFIIATFAVWKVAGHIGDFYTILLVCIGYPVAEILEALFGPEIKTFKIQTSDVMRTSIRKLTARLPKSKDAQGVAASTKVESSQ